MPKLIQGIPCDFEIKKSFSPVYRRQITQLTCIIPGGGCVYYRAKKGDVCPFCAFPKVSREVILGPGNEQIFDPWPLKSDVYREMYRSMINELDEPDKVAVFNGGSFFPPTEIPEDFQQFVYEDIASRPSVRQLMVESYPSFINEKKLCSAKEVLGSKDFMVGIGFESQDDYVRNTLLKKDIDRNLFESRIRMMQKLGVQVFVYAFLKAPGLSEKEAYDETRATIQYLHNLGVDEIALSCAFVPPGTEIEAQYKAGEFRPPWLWTILKLIEEAEKEGWPLSVGGFDDVPPPIAVPNNCPQCDDRVNSVLQAYRENGRLEASPSRDACDCHTVWRKEIQ